MSVVARAHARARVDGAPAASASRNARPRGKTIKMRGTDEKGDGAGGGGLFSRVEKLAEKVGVSLGPIGMTLQEGEVKKKTTTTTTTTEGSRGGVVRTTAEHREYELSAVERKVRQDGRHGGFMARR